MTDLTARDAIAAHVAAMLRDNRTIRTPEELYSLPVGTVIRDNDGWIGIVGDTCHASDYYTFVQDEPILDDFPMLVLYRPDDEEEQ